MTQLKRVIFVKTTSKTILLLLLDFLPFSETFAAAVLASKKDTKHDHDEQHADTKIERNVQEYFDVNLHFFTHLHFFQWLQLPPQ